MLRRRFLVTFGAAAAFSSNLPAQTAPALRRVGVAMTQGENDPGAQSRVKALRDQLGRLGWLEGRNLQLDYRWEGGVPERAQTGAEELLALQPDLIVANGTPQTAALQRLTRIIPIVFVVVTDPVGAGFVKSFSQPGGNITGFSTFEPEIGAKWVELLREFSPALRRIVAILDPSFSGFAGVWRKIEETASRLGMVATTLPFRVPADDIESALANFAREPNSGMIVFPTAINSLARERIFAAAELLRLPAIYPFQHYADERGLMAYGFDPVDLFHRSADYVNRILKGASPAALPVQAPVKFELVINLKIAKGLSSSVPPTLLSRADRVVE